MVWNGNQVNAEYGGIKSATDQPSRQTSSATPDTQQAGPSNVLALPGAILAVVILGNLMN